MRALLLALLLLAGCSRALTPADFAGTAPAFDPLAFFTGHVTSWGVVEDRGGAPTGWLTTDCVGTVEPDGSLRMTQHIAFRDGTGQTRTWHLRRTAPGHYVATANDMVGEAKGAAAGRAFRWSFVIATHPGDPLADVGFTQWMYAMPDGSVVIRTVVRKLGIVLAEVTEQFRHAG